MLNIVIIDDESATRNGLLNHIDWESLGIGMIQTACSGQEALAVCEQFQPDVILSDIRMRGMDGVEACRILHKRFPDAQIIFISGYSDKEYLKAAIELGAVNYVEKPINSVELEGAVRKAVKAVMDIRKHKSNHEVVLQSAEYIKHKVLFALLDRHIELTGELERDIEISGLFDNNYPLFRIGILRASVPVTNISRFKEQLDKRLDTAECDIYRDFRDNRRMILLMAGTEMSIGDNSAIVRAYSKAAAENTGNPALFFALGECVPDKREIYRSYESAQNAEKTVFYLGYGNTGYPGSDTTPFQFDASLYDSFSQALENGDETSSVKILEMISSILYDNKAVLDSFVHNIFFTLDHKIALQYQRLFPDVPDRTGFGIESDFQKLGAIDTIDEMHRYMLLRVQDLLKVINQEKDSNSVVKQITRYMQQNFECKSISVRQLADEFYLTPTYLSALFKRKTGKTIGEYLTKVRMEKAKILLKDKRLKLYHIADRVGYEDSNYFAKIFKKQFGVAPSEYRDNMR